MTDLGDCSLHRSASSMPGVVAVPTGADRATTIAGPAPASGPPPATLRRAAPVDLAAITALEAACFDATDGAFSRRQLRTLLANPNAWWLLNGDARAMACWLKVSNGRARWARLYSLAVHPALRGRGWGDRLLEAGFAWMRQEGLTRCRAEVRADNHAARRLYARHGFVETGLLPDYYAPGVDGVRLIGTTA